ncbi:MAG: glutathione peroxidase [Candidatus Obscuribacterales bacterium]|nr:glutathione peroxidase [Steroidobacteraceae bacterium]
MSYRNSIRRLACGLVLLASGGLASAADCPAFLNQDLQKLRSSERVNLCKAFAGKPMLIVNTASHCGFAPQFKGLQSLHEKYKDKGLVVLGFPSDDFNQESKDETETADVCYINYGVKFTMLSPSPVKGSGANPIFKELARQTKAPAWNFNKYLVNADGTVVKHFGSTVAPDSAEMTKAIDAVLSASKGT